METVLFRADGSQRLGLGHVTRCLALAIEAKSRGLEPVFVCRDGSDNVTQRIRRLGFVLELLPESLSPAADRDAIIRLATGRKASAVVVDLCNTLFTADISEYAAYINAVASLTRTIVIDDLTRAAINPAVVVDPNVGVTRDQFPPSDATYLLGPAFALLDGNFERIGRLRSHAVAPIHRIVVSLGGGELPVEGLLTILQGLNEAFGGTPHVSLVAGRNAGESIRQEARKVYGSRCDVIGEVPSLWPLFETCDLAVVSGGVTKYEAAAAGVPALLVAAVPHQEEWARKFADTGAAAYLGPLSGVSAGTVADACRELGVSVNRATMIGTARTLVDGRGTERLVDVLTASCAA